MSWWKNLFGTGSSSDLEAPAPPVIENPSISDIDDHLYPEAVKLVLQSGNASISIVQRTLKIGYGRASRFVEQMECDFLISPMNEAGYRRVLSPDEGQRLRDIAEQEAQTLSIEEPASGKPRAALRLVSSKKR